MRRVSRPGRALPLCPRVRWHASLVETALALMAGRFEEAERLAHRTAQLRQPSVRNNVAPFYGVQLYLLYEEQGRLEGSGPRSTWRPRTRRTCRSGARGRALFA